MRTHPLTWSAALLLMLGASGGASSQIASGPAIEVEVTRPTRGGIHRWVTLPGSVRPMQEAMLFAKVPGYVKEIRVDKGDAVKAGAVLAELEAPELIADLARSRAETEVARAELERVEQAVKQAPDLIMPVEADRARGKYEVAKANLERVQTLLSFTKITAPFGGVITRRYVDLGAFIPAATSGSTAQTAALLTLTDFNTVRVQVAVPQAEASRVVKGQPARFNVDALPNRKFEGTVTRYAYALDEVSKTMLVEVELQNPKLELRPGMYASVQLGLEHHDDAMLIPVAALVMEKTNAFVFAAIGDTAKKKPVKIGFNDGSKVEILEGVDAGEQLILVGKRALSDGQKIQIARAQ